MINFYDVDKDYIQFLQRAETDKRGFTRVPNMEYGERQQKFLCGIVLQINDFNYYVPVSSNKQRMPDTVLVLIPSDRFNQIKGTLKFNYMIPVPDCAISERQLKLEMDPKRRRFLQEQLKYCQSIETSIMNQARRTYKKWHKEIGSETFYKNSCDFAFLEEKSVEYEVAQGNAKTQ